MKNEYEIRGETTVIFIRRRNSDIYEFLIDTGDLPLLVQEGGSWCVDLPSNTKKYPSRKPYAIRSARRKDGGRYFVKLHRFLVNAPDDKVVDHISGDTLDNRKCNLRVTDRFVNMQNLQGPSRNNKSGELNVHYNRFENVWIAAVMRNGVLQRAKRKSFEEAVKCARQMREGTYEPLEVGRRVC
ncbi:hypothetical protein GCM10008915_36520 [Bifidobacterium pullorum subsp. gallinarum]